MNILNNEGQTILMIACKFCNNDDAYDIIKQLIDKGSDPKVLDNQGNTALAYLLMDGHKNLKTVELLSSLMESKNNHIVDFRQKYLEFMDKLNCAMKPLSGDLYNWEHEFMSI